MCSPEEEIATQPLHFLFLTPVATRSQPGPFGGSLPLLDPRPGPCATVLFPYWPWEPRAMHSEAEHYTFHQGEETQTSKGTVLVRSREKLGKRRASGELGFCAVLGPAVCARAPYALGCSRHLAHEWRDLGWLTADWRKKS